VCAKIDNFAFANHVLSGELEVGVCVKITDNDCKYFKITTLHITVPGSNATNATLLS
jgi:hypothetical protein|tara:strand:- start:144 stop:314 length:171 start_codon:yes stop_codon:yes gene_type:complete